MLSVCCKSDLLAARSELALKGRLSKTDLLVGFQLLTSCQSSRNRGLARFNSDHRAETENGFFEVTDNLRFLA